MLELFPWFSFLIAITLLTLTPGVDTLMVLRRATVSWQVGLMASLGICCGLFIHGALSALGVAAVLASSPQLFMWIQYLGAAYLIYLGLQAILDAVRGRDLLLVGSSKPVGQGRAFYQGFLNNLLNPKTLLFYMALLPQFILPEYSALTQSLMMAALHFVIAMIWQGVLVFAVHRARTLFAKGAFLKAVDAVSGGVFIALGLRIALAERSI